MCLNVASLCSGDHDSQEDFRDVWINSVQFDHTGLLRLVLPVVLTFDGGISGSVSAQTRTGSVLFPVKLVPADSCSQL